MKKKNVVALVVITSILGCGVVKGIPKAVDLVAENTKEVVDYTVGSLNTNEANNERSKEITNKINDGFSDQLINLQIGEDQISINTNYNEEIFEVDSLSTDAPVKFSLTDSTRTVDDEITITVEGTNINEEHSITLDSLSKNKYITIQLEYDEYQRTYFVQTLPTSFPKIEKAGLSIYEGDYYSDIFPREDGGFIYKMSNEGEIIYYKTEEGFMMNFAKWEINGKERYSYFSEKNADDVEFPGSTYGEYIVMNENYEEIDRVRTLPSNDYEIYTNKVESHDFIIIDDNHYMVMDYVMDTPKAEHLSGDIKIDTRIIASYIQETKDDEVVWEWISTDYEEFYEGSVEHNDYSNSERVAADYLHINSMFIDPADDNIIMSLRTQDAAIKVDKSTKEILWVFGGKNDDFELSNKQKPSKQHHATMTKAGNLLLFDNGTANEQTRIIEATLDEKNKKVEVYKEYQIDGAFSRYTGSVQKIDEENDVFLIGWGMSRENQHAMMSEIDFKNNKVLTEIIEGNIDNDSYRFSKFK